MSAQQEIELKNACEIAANQAQVIQELHTLNAAFVAALEICMGYARKGETLPWVYHSDFNALVAKARQ